MPIHLDTLNLALAERKLCEEALRTTGSIVEAAKVLGVTRHALKRRMVKYGLRVPGHSQGGERTGRGLELAAAEF
jgi:DNA-binding NtrC family response regulator